jgi:glucose/arabinose dehydrogenase
VSAVALVCLAVCAAPLTTASAATKLVSIGAGLRGPDGLAATVYAKGLRHVSALATDAEGRVWVTTAASDDKATDGLYVVAQAGAKPVQVLGELDTPLGIVWVADTLFLSQAHGVLALSGFDGTAFSSRSTIVAFPDGTGEANGITVAPDGRLYVGISAPCNACTSTDGLSASIISFEPDGSDVRAFATDIRAPIGLAFYPGTSNLLVTMNQRDDLGKKTPGDWLALVRDGESWGFPSCYGQDTDTCADTPRPVAELDAHAAVGGIAILTDASLGSGAVVAEWMTGKVLFVGLTADGSRATANPTTLLTGIKNPVAVLHTTAGALLVGDWTTGKLYRVATAA